MLLATCAALLRRRRWKVVHLLTLGAEAVVIAIMARSFAPAFTGLYTQTGVGTWIFVSIDAVLTGWILFNLFRGEVLRYLWRGRSAFSSADARAGS